MKTFFIVMLVISIIEITTIICWKHFMKKMNSSEKPNNSDKE